MKKMKMLYGAGEGDVALEPVDKTEEGADIVLLPTNAIKFGKGEGSAETLKTIATKDDEKLRFVWDIDGMGSGAVFAGDKLVSSKILNIESDEVLARTEEDGTTVEHKNATKIIVTWFGEGQSNRTTDAEGNEIPLAQKAPELGIHKTVFDLIDPDEFTDLVKDLELRVAAIEEFDASTKRVTVKEGTALDVTYSEEEHEVRDAEGNLLKTQTHVSYELEVLTDGDSVQIVNKDGKNVLATAKYKLNKLTEADDDYNAEFTSQYQLVVKDPITGEETVAGETINIFRDFLVKDAHVCTFDYKDETTKLVWVDGQAVWDESHSVNYGGDIAESQLPWAKLSDGTFEQAVLGKGIKYGHTYLHLILNTKGEDELENPNALTTDVFLDFTDIFKQFSGDGKYIEIDDNGVISLNTTETAATVDELLGADFDEDTLTEHVKGLDDAVAALDEDVAAIEESYVQSVDIAAPKAEGSLFNTVTLTTVTGKDEEGKVVTKEDTFDIANATFYTALNAALAALKANDESLAGLLTWGNLD